MRKSTGEVWQVRIDDARKFRDDKLLNDVRRHLDLYRGHQWGGLSKYNNDLITVNMIFPLIRNQIGFYYYRDPKFFVRPANEASSEMQASLSESILNYWWREVGVQKQMRFMLYDVHIFGCAISEVGWRFQTDVLKKRNGERIEYHEYIKTDKPYVRRTSPAHFLIDPKSGMEPIVNSDFVAKELFRKLDDVKKDPKFSNTKNLEAEVTMDENELARYGEEVVKLVEVHDRKNNELVVFASNYERPLLQIAHPYDYLEGHNFEWLQFNHIPDETYGISQIALLEDQQHELNRTRTQMFAHRRRVSNRRYVFDEGAVSDTALSKLEDAEGGALVGVGNIDRIRPLEDARLSFDVPMIESVIKQDIRELTGMPASQFGVMDNKSRSATEHNQADRAMQSRVNDNFVLCEEFIRNNGRKFFQVIQKNLDKKTAVKIAGPKGESWVKASKDEIQGEYNVTMDPGSTSPHAEEIERKQAIDILTIILKIPGMNVRRAMEDVLKTFNKQRVEEYFTPQFDQIHGGATAPLAKESGGPGGAGGVRTPGQIEQESAPDLMSMLTNALQTGPKA